MVNKILKAITWIRESKGLKNYLVFSITLFFTLNIGSALAQSSGGAEEVGTYCIDIQKSYSEQGLLNGTLADDTGPNVLSNTENSIMSTLTSGIINLAPQVSCEYDALQASSASILTKRGVLGTVDNGISAVFENAPSVNLYAHVMKEWVPGYDQSKSSTYAATSDGYTFLMDIGADGLWEKLRTIAYVLFVVVLIAAGFMIMFRSKIGGQTAITVFNALPDVIIGLILVTFSFAIVGLVLNLSTMLINVIGSLLDPTGKDLITVTSPFSLVEGLFTGIKYTAGQAAAGVGATAIITALLAFIGALLASQAIPVAGQIAAIALGIGVLLAFFIALAIFVFASVKVYITLIKAYLGILLDTILAPIYLAVSAIPGRKSMRGDWFNRILRNALTFPLVFFFVNLGIYLLQGGLNIRYPKGLAGGDISQSYTDDGAIGWLLKGVLVIALYFFAAEAPKMLTDFLPSNQGKGAEGAMEGFKKGLSKIPIVGSILGG